MNPSIDHSINASFMLWLDYVLLQNGRAFYNVTGELIKTPSNISGCNIYSSYQSQWVYDASVSGAIIPSGVNTGAGFLSTGTRSFLDFQHGKFLAKDNHSGVSASYASKEINIYPSTENEEDLIFANKFVLHSKTNQNPPVLKGDERYYPAIFLRYNPGKNKALDFDGIKETVVSIRATVLVDSSYLLDGVCGLLRDSKDSSFALLYPSQYPFDAFGRLKNGSYNYRDEVVRAMSDVNRVVFIKDVSISPFRASVNQMIGKNILGAFIDFDLSICRYGGMYLYQSSANNNGFFVYDESDSFTFKGELFDDSLFELVEGDVTPKP